MLIDNQELYIFSGKTKQHRKNKKQASTEQRYQMKKPSLHTEKYPPFLKKTYWVYYIEAAAAGDRWCKGLGRPKVMDDFSWAWQTWNPSSSALLLCSALNIEELNWVRQLSSSILALHCGQFVVKASRIKAKIECFSWIYHQTLT